MHNATINTYSSLAYAVSELPALTGLGLTLINERIQSGQLRARKAGRRTLVLKVDLEAFLLALPEVAA